MVAVNVGPFIVGVSIAVVQRQLLLDPAYFDTSSVSGL